MSAYIMDFLITLLCIFEQGRRNWREKTSSVRGQCGKAVLSVFGMNTQMRWVNTFLKDH